MEESEFIFRKRTSGNGRRRGRGRGRRVKSQGVLCMGTILELSCWFSCIWELIGCVHGSCWTPHWQHPYHVFLGNLLLPASTVCECLCVQCRCCSAHVTLPTPCPSFLTPPSLPAPLIGLNHSFCRIVSPPLFSLPFPIFSLCGFSVSSHRYRVAYKDHRHTLAHKKLFQLRHLKNVSGPYLK